MPSKPVAVQKSVWQHVQTNKPMLSIALTPAADMPPPHQPGIGTGRAFALAVLAETIILVVMVSLLAKSEHDVKHISTPTPLTLVNEPEPPKPVEKPKPPEPKPKPVVQKIVQPKRVLTPPPPKPEPVPTPLPKDAAPTPFTAPPPPPPPAPQPDMSAQLRALANYQSQVHAAVQAAVYYPPAAVTMHFSGKALVEFHLQDIHVSGARIITSSGLGMIDNAALQAVQNAQYPTPPESLRGKDQTFRVLVELSLTHND